MCGSHFLACAIERLFPTGGAELEWIFLFLLNSDIAGACSRSKMLIALSLEELVESCRVSEELEQAVAELPSPADSSKPSAILRSAQQVNSRLTTR